MSETDPSDRFASTESYYAEHRPEYGDEALAHLRDRFALGETDRVLDLGCGAGQIAVPLAAHVGEVVGMDPDEAMIQQAERRARAAGRENCTWVVGSDAELAGLAGPFRLVAMGRSFHWTDQERTLDHVHRLTDSDGGVAILGDAEWLTRGTAEWQEAVYDLAAEYLDDLPERTGPVEYDDPYDELLAAHGFTDVETVTYEVQREWSVDAAVGYVFSLSFCAPDRFGDDAGEFEAALRERLADCGPGPFVEDAEISVVTGRSEPSRE